MVARSSGSKGTFPTPMNRRSMTGASTLSSRQAGTAERAPRGCVVPHMPLDQGLGCGLPLLGLKNSTAAAGGAVGVLS
jgi:hypothetical protein